VVISGHKWPSVAISGHQWPSVAISGNIFAPAVDATRTPVVWEDEEVSRAVVTLKGWTALSQSLKTLLLCHRHSAWQSAVISSDQQ
jgi:hypothetical protein